MPDPKEELFVGLRGLVDQLADESVPALARVAAGIAAGPYLEGIIRQLVDQARDDGASWQDLADVFVTSPQNVKARFGSYRSYDDAGTSD